MDNINFDLETDSENANLRQVTQINSSVNSKLYLSNPIIVELVDFIDEKEDIDYEFNITYKSEQWRVIRTLTEIRNLISSLRCLNYSFIPSETLYGYNQSRIKEINLSVINFLRYIIYRYDILTNALATDFFLFYRSTYPDKLIEDLNKENLEKIYNFKLENSDMTLSDFIYDPDLGLLILALEDQSIISRVGRFWSLVDYEILGICLIYQRTYDHNKNPYFRKLIKKNFDARVSKLGLCKSKGLIFIGLENGTVQSLNLNRIEKSQIESNEDTLLVITEGNNFKYLSDRITGMASYSNDYLFISSQDNKLVIVSASSTNPELLFNGSIKKRCEGKGHITDIKITNKNLFIITATNKILIYEILNTVVASDTIENSRETVKIDFCSEIECADNIRSVFLRSMLLYIAYDNKFQSLNLKQLDKNTKDTHSFDEMNLICFDGSLDEKICYSSQYVKLDVHNSITSLTYFSDMKLIILGLKNGVLVALSSKTFEVLFAKKMSDHSITKMILLEENYIVIVGDLRGNISFIKIGN